MEKPKEVTPGEIARAEDVSKITVIRWCRDGRIRCRRTPGGRWRIPVDDRGRTLKPTWLQNRSA